MKHREQRKRKQRGPLDAIHDQSDVEEHLAVGWGRGIWACSMDQTWGSSWGGRGSWGNLDRSDWRDLYQLDGTRGRGGLVK